MILGLCTSRAASALLLHLLVLLRLLLLVFVSAAQTNKHDFSSGARRVRETCFLCVGWSSLVGLTWPAVTITAGDASGLRLWCRRNSKQATRCYLLAVCVDRVFIGIVSPGKKPLMCGERMTPSREKGSKIKWKRFAFCFLCFLCKKKRRKKTAGLILDDIEGYCLISWMAIWHRTKIIPFFRRSRVQRVKWITRSHRCTQNH